MSKFTGKLKPPIVDYLTGKLSAVIEISEDFRQAYEELKDCEKLIVEIKRYRRKRSLDANALLWLCIGRIADATRTDKMQVYKDLIKSYGQYTYIVVKKNAVNKMQKYWRVCEEVGEVSVGDEIGVQLLCYYGSSTYDTKEFSILLDGTIQEMENIGLQRPSSKEMRMALEKWEKLKSGSK